MDLLAFDEVLKLVGAVTPSLLLGNGFSIACDPAYAYESVYRWATNEQLVTGSVAACFDCVGTPDFETVIRDLRGAASLCDCVGTGSAALTAAADAVTDCLAKALAGLHLASPFDIAHGKMAACREFLTRFGTIFSTNYDLLLYWMHMQMPAQERTRFRDGFFDSVPGSLDRRFHAGGHTPANLWFLHGALHLYEAGGDTCKRVHTGSPGGDLLTQITQCLDQGALPLVITEGSPAGKLRRIEANTYLSAALDAFAAMAGCLLTFGHALADVDDHLRGAIARNARLSRLYVGVHGAPDDPSSIELETRMKLLAKRRDGVYPNDPLEVCYYDASSARVWG